MKLRGHYEKPSEKRAREKAEAVRRARKLARKKIAARRPASDEAEARPWGAAVGRLICAESMGAKIAAQDIGV